MRIGLTIFTTDLAIRPDELGREAEARGFESLFVPEHTHIPLSRKTPWPGGSELPEEYKRAHDPFIALAFAAAATERLVVGTGVSLVAQHDPIVLAKEIASLDMLSGGRFVLGVGFGWNVDEMEHHGVDPGRRRTISREKVLAMKALWTEDAAAYNGKHVSFSASWSWPKPAQRPHPPVLVGGTATPTVWKHIVDWADGWLPIEGGYDIVGQVGSLRRFAEAAGRDPSTIQVTVLSGRGDPAVIERYREAGVDRVTLALPPAPRDVVLRSLDKRAEVLERLKE